MHCSRMYYKLYPHSDWWCQWLKEPESRAPYKKKILADRAQFVKMQNEKILTQTLYSLKHPQTGEGVRELGLGRGTLVVMPVL